MSTADPSRSSMPMLSMVAGPFPHEKLDASRVAVERARGAKALAQHIPRGHRSIADHLLRSSWDAVLLLAEGCIESPSVPTQRAAAS